MNRPEKNQSGIAMMVVLWIMVLLSALATEYLASMKTETHTTRNFKEDIESYQLAKAGVNLAIAELMKTAMLHTYNEQIGFLVGKTPIINPAAPNDPNAPPPSNEPVFDVVERLNIPLGFGTVSYWIQDENGKININTASRELLIKAMTVSGLQIGELRDTIADSILDWIDKDENKHLNGAESEYYKTLSPPYNAKNADLYSIDELIKVKGMTEEILYGTPQNTVTSEDTTSYLGLDKFFTVLNVSTVNPNTAPLHILQLYYTESQIEKIFEARAEKGYFSNSISTHFRITSTGRINNSKTNHTIVAIVEKMGNDKRSTLLIRYWNDNLTNI
jgi:general secretion pathway protein K